MNHGYIAATLTFALSAGFVVGAEPRTDGRVPDVEAAEVRAKLAELGDAYFRALHQTPDPRTNEWFTKRAAATLQVTGELGEAALARSATTNDIEAYLHSGHFAYVVSPERAQQIAKRVAILADERCQILDVAVRSRRDAVQAALGDQDWQWAERLSGLRRRTLEMLRDGPDRDLEGMAKRLVEADPATSVAAMAYLRARVNTNKDLRDFLIAKFRDPQSAAFQSPALSGLAGQR